MKPLYNITIILVIAIMYFINQKYKMAIDNEYLRFFMSGYFNDIVGCIALSAYINLVSGIGNGSYKIISLKHFLGIILLAGLFWEFVTPIYRADTVTDIFDIFAYLTGGLIYYLILCIYNCYSKEG